MRSRLGFDKSLYNIHEEGDQYSYVHTVLHAKAINKDIFTPRRAMSRAVGGRLTFLFDAVFICCLCGALVR